MTAPTFQIPTDVIEPIIQAHVTTAIITALGGHQHLMERAITGVLTQKVNSEGKPSNYGSDIQYIQWAMQTAVTNAVTKVLQEEVAKQEDQIRALLTAELRKSKSPLVKQLIEGMTKGVVNATQNKWQIKVSYDRD